MSQQLTVVHRDFRIGALHLKRVSVLLASHGFQIEILQQVRVGLCSLALGGLRGFAAGIPQALDASHAPSRIWCNLYGDGLPLVGIRRLYLVHIELHGAVVVRAHGELVAREFGARGHRHESHC